MGVEAIGRTFALMPSESASFLLSRFLFFPDIALYRLAKRGGLRPRRSAICGSWLVLKTAFPQCHGRPRERSDWSTLRTRHAPACSDSV